MAMVMRAPSPQSVKPVLEERSFFYTLYGLRVRSDLRLPMPHKPCDARSAPGLNFTLAAPRDVAPTPRGKLAVEARCHCQQHAGAVVTRVYRGEGEAWLWHADGGLFNVVPARREVVIHPADDIDERARALALMGQVAIFALHQFGYPTLHASAVVTPRGAVAFLGPHGGGKSTMAAAFLRRGAMLLTDDALPLHSLSDGICGGQGVPLMKVWHATADGTLGLDEELPDLLDGSAKKLLTLDGRYPFAPQPALLRAIYLLARYDPATAGHADVTIRRLGGRGGLAALLEHSYLRNLLPPTEVARLIPLYTRLLKQAPPRVLAYPNGFEHQEAVHQAIMADMEQDR